MNDRRLYRAGLAAIVAALPLAGCRDPLREQLLDALGEEVPGPFAETAFHRPGQPCLACHTSYEGAEPELTIGGTLFFVPPDGNLFVVPNFIVRLVDAVGATTELQSNACGNFYATKDQFNPSYPMLTEVLAPSPDDSTKLTTNAQMRSRIARDGSCGNCHMHPVSPLSPGAIFVTPVTGLTLTPPDPAVCPPPSFAPQVYQ
jgi:hypothetical protein